MFIKTICKMNDLNVSPLILTENKDTTFYLVNYEYVTFSTPQHRQN